MKGGGVARLPLKATTKTVEDLQAEWDFKYITAHGLVNKKIFVVPENTYIYFTATAGEFTSIEEHLEILSFIYNLLNTEDSLRRWWAKTLKDLQEGTLFAEKLYKPNVAPGNVNTASKMRAFYEPGDIIQDLELRFKNNNRKPIFPIGAYQIPIRGSLKTAVDRFNENEHTVVDAETDKTYFDKDINLFRRRLYTENKTTWTLFDSINALDPLSRKKKLVIVDTCRVPSVVELPANLEIPAVVEERRLCRSLSVCGRQYGEACNPGPTIHTINVRSLNKAKGILGLTVAGTPNDNLKKAIVKLLEKLYDEDGERQPADRGLLADVLTKAEAAGRQIRGGKSRRHTKKRRSTRRRRA